MLKGAKCPLYFVENKSKCKLLQMRRCVYVKTLNSANASMMLSGYAIIINACTQQRKS